MDMEEKLKSRHPQQETQTESTTVMDETSEPLSKRSRSIRSHYREIETRINEGKDEIGLGDCEKFMDIMNEFENIHQHVNRPREQVADAEALLGLTSTLVASVKTQTTGGVTPAEFVSCLIREFGQTKPMKGHSDNSPNIMWHKIGFAVSPIFMHGKGCMTMLGPMQNELKPRKLIVRAKRGARSVGNARPKELEKTAEVVTDTDRNILMMFEILKKKKRVVVENLVLNHSSFAQTVENLFALSFLVKDGRVRISVDENGSQVVVPCNGPTAEEIKNGVAKNHSFIFRLDFNDWKLMKSVVPEGQEFMPQRNALPDASLDQAKAGLGDESRTQAEVVSNDSEMTNAAPAVKKFSRNYGYVLQNSDLTEPGDASTLNWNCKRERSSL